MLKRLFTAIIAVCGFTSASLTFNGSLTDATPAGAGVYDVLVYGDGSLFVASAPARLEVIQEGTLLLLQ